MSDPDLLRDEVFQLFRVEGAARSLYWADSWLSRPQQFQAGKWVDVGTRPETTWRATLARLARAGSIDYDRLLDECINAFLRDFRPSQLGWYVGMHQELAPTIEELAVRWEHYARLLASPASSGVGLGQTVLEALLRAGRLDLERFVAASGPTLYRAEKGIVLKQLKLLGQVAKKQQALSTLIVEIISPALSHERVELREAALALAQRLDAPVAREQWRQRPGHPDRVLGQVGRGDKPTSHQCPYQRPEIERDLLGQKRSR